MLFFCISHDALLQFLEDGPKEEDEIIEEGDIGVCGIAVLVNFSCGISVILILNCVIAVFSKTCGMRYFWPFGQRYLIRKILFYTVSDPFLA